jgi:alpha-D-ribose 1-methylphosphonate 5-triphosphate synthase subunit PhnH
MIPSVARLKEGRFDFTHDSQRVFRILMAALAAPGEIRTLPAIELAVSRPEFHFILLPFLTLLDLETSFAAEGADAGAREEVARYLEINTGARSLGSAEADFILCLGPSLGGRFAVLKKGTLDAPHRSATVFYLVDGLFSASNDGALELRLSGPGIKQERRFFAAGLDEREPADWQNHRTGYPAGVDICLVSRAGDIVGLPRSSTIAE